MSCSTVSFGAADLCARRLRCRCHCTTASRTGRLSLPKPPPVGRPLTVRRLEPAVKILDGDKVVLIAQPRGQLDIRVPPIDLAAARAAAAIPQILAKRRAPTCVVCGPARPDGFRIFPGSLAPRLVATPGGGPRPDARTTGRSRRPSYGQRWIVRAGRASKGPTSSSCQ
jgi:hypothetical protein